MKILIIFSICVLVLAGCTSVEYQKMQAERDQLLKNYEDLREENSELKLKNSITDTLLGKWKFLSLEMAESDVTQEVAEAKAALYALELQNLTLEFFVERGIYHYRGRRGGTEVFGQWTVITIRYGDEPFPVHSIHQTRRSRDGATPFRSECGWKGTWIVERAGTGHRTGYWYLCYA